MCDGSPLVSFSLSNVQYCKGDIIGKIFALYSLLPLAITVAFITLIIFRRDLHTIAFFMGLLFNELINEGLKVFFRSPRPHNKSDLFTEHGMPSSHAQFAWFFTSYIILFLFFRLCLTANKFLWKSGLSLFCAINAIAISISRIYLEYHTSMQVIVGTVVGCFLGTVWFIVVHFRLTPVFPEITMHPFAEWLLLRDTTLIPNVLFFEYTQARQEARTRSRMKSSIIKSQ